VLELDIWPGARGIYSATQLDTIHVWPESSGQLNAPCKTILYNYSNVKYVETNASLWPTMINPLGSKPKHVVHLGAIVAINQLSPAPLVIMIPDGFTTGMWSATMNMVDGLYNWLTETPNASLTFVVDPDVTMPEDAAKWTDPCATPSPDEAAPLHRTAREVLQAHAVGPHARFLSVIEYLSEVGEVEFAKEAGHQDKACW
jgi:hypothetical protein